MENTVPKIGFDLSGLEILIIGAKLGIGLSLAEVCAAQGARLVFVDIESPVELAKNLESTFKTWPHECSTFVLAKHANQRLG